MIDITDIHAGWLTLHIGTHKFGVSYLTDVEEELNKIFILPEIGQGRALVLYFDGEGKDLYLTMRLEDDNLVILWEEWSFGLDPYLYFLTYSYEEFKTEWCYLWDKICEDYYKHFDLDTKIELMDKEFEDAENTE
jgi:hypothetical protein